MLDSERIQHWFISNKIEERSLDQFWRSIETYQKKLENIIVKEIGEFDRNFLSIKIEAINLWLGNWPECDERYIQTKISLMYKKAFYRKKEKDIPLKDIMNI